MRTLRTCVIVTWLVVAVIGQPAGTACAAEAVDVALVLAADVSRSINDEEFDLQRQGYAAALTSPRVLKRDPFRRSRLHRSHLRRVGWLC